MGHIIKKRTKFQKGNFKPAWDCLNGYLSTIGYYLPSKLYRQFQLPYYYPSKTTTLQKKYYDFMHKKSIMNWLA